MVKVKATATAAVRRGAESWTYLYVTLGFALTIEVGAIALITPLRWPDNFITCFAAFAFTIYAWLFNGWLPNKLIGLKTAYETAARSTNFLPVVAVFWAIVAIAIGLCTVL